MSALCIICMGCTSQTYPVKVPRKLDRTLIFMLNWKLIREELDAAIWREEDDELRRSIFIGTAAHINPSGKIYRPWALEEVACSRCLKKFHDCSKRKPCIPSLDGESLHCNF